MVYFSGGNRTLALSCGGHWKDCAAIAAQADGAYVDVSRRNLSCVRWLALTGTASHQFAHHAHDRLPTQGHD